MNCFFSYVFRLLKTYFIWSLFYFLIEFIEYGHSQTIMLFLKDCFIRFFFLGSHYHFWYFPALIFSVCITTFLYKFKLKKTIAALSVIFYIIGCLGCSYYKFGIRIPIINNLILSQYFNFFRRILCMAFPFFISGYIAYKIESKLKNNISTVKLNLLWLISSILWLAEILIVIVMDIQSNIILTFGLYVLLLITLIVLINNPFTKYIKISKCINIVANTTYYIHPFYIECLTIFGNRVLNISISETPMYFLVIMLTFISGYLIYRSGNTYIIHLVK